MAKSGGGKKQRQIKAWVSQIWWCSELLNWAIEHCKGVSVTTVISPSAHQIPITQKLATRNFLRSLIQDLFYSSHTQLYRAYITSSEMWELPITALSPLPHLQSSVYSFQWQCLTSLTTFLCLLSPIYTFTPPLLFSCVLHQPLHLTLPLPWPSLLPIRVRQLSAVTFCSKWPCLLKCSHKNSPRNEPKWLSWSHSWWAEHCCGPTSAMGLCDRSAAWSNTP